jgi:transcriptional regulator with XRE-family HTH domain
MGSASRRDRHIPERLAEKLLHIRLALGLSQNEMLKQLGSPEKLQQSSISGYERGVREPPLLIVLEYARSANLYVDVLLDDELDLPPQIPSRRRHEGIRSAGSLRRSPIRA